MEAEVISPTPPPDKIFRIALLVVVIFGAAQLSTVLVYYVGKRRAEYLAAHPTVTAPAATPAATAAPVAPQTTPAPATVPSTPSAAVLSAAERLLKEATELRDKGDTTNALARLQDAAQRDPKNANVLAEMAMIYESIQLFERSNETWRKIQEIGPSAGALYELADEAGDDASMSEAEILALARAFRAASHAMSDVPTPFSTKCRCRIPVRSWIH